MNKFILYLFVLPLVIYTMDSVNFNSIFKKNKVFQAKIFYIYHIWYVIFCMIF